MTSENRPFRKWALSNRFFQTILAFAIFIPLHVNANDDIIITPAITLKILDIPTDNGKEQAKLEWSTGWSVWNVEILGTNYDEEYLFTQIKLTGISGRQHGMHKTFTNRWSYLITGKTGVRDFDGDGLDELFVERCWTRGCGPIILSERASGLHVLFEEDGKGHDHFEYKDLNGDGTIEVIDVSDNAGAIPKIYAYSRKTDTYVRSDLDFPEYYEPRLQKWKAKLSKMDLLESGKGIEFYLRAEVVEILIVQQKWTKAIEEVKAAEDRAAMNGENGPMIRKIRRLASASLEEKEN